MRKVDDGLATYLLLCLTQGVYARILAWMTCVSGPLWHIACTPPIPSRHISPSPLLIALFLAFWQS